MKVNSNQLIMMRSGYVISWKRKVVSIGLTVCLGGGVGYAAFLTIFPVPAVTVSSQAESQSDKPLPSVPPQAVEKKVDKQVDVMQQLEALQQRSKPLPSGEPKIVDVCSSFKDKLPVDYKLYAGGGYGGRKLGYQIDQSGHEATGFEVSANIPNSSVVLALGAYEPSVWHIRKGPTTRIVGVFVSGYHRQKLEGLDADIPVLNSSYEDRTPCGYFYLTKESIRSADEKLRHIVGNSAESYHLASNGQVVIGEPLLQAEPEKNYPLAGKLGLDALEAEGALRPAGEEDLAEFYEKKRIAQKLPPLNIVGGGGEKQNLISMTHTLYTYVVLKTMTFPAGLYGGNAVTFIVQRGVPRPRGNPGHSAVYDMNTLTCQGALCR